jgi:GAF domain-containing protein
MTKQRFLRSSDAFAELDRLSFGDMRLDDALTRIVDVVARTVPGAHAASVTLLAPNGAFTAAFSGKVALDLDDHQYENGHGPCLAASAATITVSVTDTAGDRRWPDWADRAIEAGVHSSVSVGLPLRDSVSGALNVYAAEPRAFDDDAVILAETFAGYAAMAMANASRSNDSDTAAKHPGGNHA